MRPVANPKLGEPGGCTAREATANADCAGMATGACLGEQRTTDIRLTEAIILELAGVAS